MSQWEKDKGLSLRNYLRNALVSKHFFRCRQRDREYKKNVKFSFICKESRKTGRQY